MILDEAVLQWLTAQLPHLSRHDLRDLWAHISQRPKNTQYLQQEALHATQEEALHAAIQRLRAGEPLAYVLGSASFWDFELEVNPQVLIPRPDSEILIECVQRYVDKPKKIIDLGTGSGVLALALARLYPQAHIVAIDRSEAALAVARRNAARLNLQHLVFQVGNWLDGVTETVDVVVANPPYLAADDPHLPDLRHEPRSALVAQENGLADLKDIIHAAPNVLNKDGFLFLEHGWKQAEAVRALFMQSAWESITTEQDYAQRDRVTWARWGG